MSIEIHDSVLLPTSITTFNPIEMTFEASGVRSRLVFGRPDDLTDHERDG
jgi:hypothetical protein